MWLSLVERYVRDVEVAGSNPVTPIFKRGCCAKRLVRQSFSLDEIQPFVQISLISKNISRLERNMHSYPFDFSNKAKKSCFWALF